MALQQATQKVHPLFLKQQSSSFEIKTQTAASADATNVGSEEKYIEKIISDERTNSLIVMANENALETITQLIKDLDVDVDPASRAQIHVVYLEHAKAEDIAQVLSNLSNNTSGNSRNSSRSSSKTIRNNLETTLETTLETEILIRRIQQ